MREKTGKRVLASGAFELLHPGHVRFLAEAKRVGGGGSRLIVVVARDETIRRRKGREPILGEEARKEMVSMLKPVDETILGHVPFSFEKVMEEVKPNMVVFGYDQENLMREFMRFIESRGLSVEVVRLGKFSSQEPSSTSELIRRAAEILDKGSSR